MATMGTSKPAAVRARFTHPVIDSDGHMTSSSPGSWMSSSTSGDAQGASHVSFARDGLGDMYNHTGHYAAAGEAVCKVLFIGWGDATLSHLAVRFPRGRRELGG